MALGPWLIQEDFDAVQAVLSAGDLMSGKRVQQLEERLAEYFGKRHCVCVSSGTAALECAFVATGEGYWLHPHGFIALYSAARAAGRTPQAGLMHRSVGTDVLGMQHWSDCRVHDCAHRFDKGAAHAEVSCFSLSSNKFLATSGGGFLVTNDSVVAAQSRHYRNHGRDGGPEIFREGRNLRMGEINAALGLSQLARIKEILDRREDVAGWYDELLGQTLRGTRRSWFLYPYHCPGHKQRSLESFRLFNTATQEDRDTALLPIWPTMTREEVEAIVRELPNA